MQLAFIIHVMIIILMLKPTTSQTCDDVVFKSEFACPKANMYFKDFYSSSGLLTGGKCCEADDPSYANHTPDCSTVHYVSYSPLAGT